MLLLNQKKRLLDGDDLQKFKTTIDNAKNLPKEKDIMYLIMYRKLVDIVMQNR